MCPDDEPTSLTFDTDDALAKAGSYVATERSHTAAVAEQIRIANRAGDHRQVEALSSALREQMSGAWDEELAWSRPEAHPLIHRVIVSHHVRHLETVWELNDWVTRELVTEGLIIPLHDGYILSEKFRADWRSKTTEAFSTAVAVFQAAGSLEDDGPPDIEGADANLADAMAILKGGRV
jgi:hypothetical protein